MSLRVVPGLVGAGSDDFAGGFADRFEEKSFGTLKFGFSLLGGKLRFGTLDGLIGVGVFGKRKLHLDFANVGVGKSANRMTRTLIVLHMATTLFKI